MPQALPIAQCNSISSSALCPPSIRSNQNIHLPMQSLPSLYQHILGTSLRQTRPCSCTNMESQFPLCQHTVYQPGVMHLDGLCSTSGDVPHVQPRLDNHVCNFQPRYIQPNFQTTMPANSTPIPATQVHSIPPPSEGFTKPMSVLQPDLELQPQIQMAVAQLPPNPYPISLDSILRPYSHASSKYPMTGSNENQQDNAPNSNSAPRICATNNCQPAEPGNMNTILQPTDRSTVQPTVSISLADCLIQEQQTDYIHGGQIRIEQRRVEQTCTEQTRPLQTHAEKTRIEKTHTEQTHIEDIPIERALSDLGQTHTIQARTEEAHTDGRETECVSTSCNPPPVLIRQSPISLPTVCADRDRSPSPLLLIPETPLLQNAGGHRHRTILEWKQAASSGKELNMKDFEPAPTNHLLRYLEKRLDPTVSIYDCFTQATLYRHDRRANDRGYG